MQMALAAFHTSTGETIPLHIITSEKQTLLECHDPAAFLSHITENHWTSPLTRDITLRGVIVHGQGAFFQLFDPFGVVSDEIAPLNADQASRLLSEIW